MMIFPDANGGWVNLQQISLRFQTQELQDKVNVLGGARDFKGIETASSSGSFHVPRHPLVVPSFSRTSRRDKSPLESQRAHLLLPQNRAAELEKPELSRTGNRKSLQKSDDGSDSQRRGAHKRRGNSVCQRIGFLRDSEACRGYAHVWTSGQKPHLIKSGRTNSATQRVTCLSLFQACQPDFPARLRVHLQHRYRRTQCEMVLRHVQQSHKVGVNPVGHWETSGKIPKKPKTKKGDIDGARGSPLRDLPEWLEEFTDNLMEQEASAQSEAPASISREPLHQELPIKVISGKHSFFTHFVKDRKCEVCKRTNIYKGSLQKMHWQIKYLEQKFLGDLITAWSSQWGMCESRHNHRYAVVVQDLASQWLQSYPCKTESSEETEKSLQKFLEPTAKPRGHFCLQFFGVWQIFRRIILESLCIKWHCRKSSTQNEGKNFCSTVSIHFWRKMVGQFHGMLLLCAKRSRLLIGRENTSWTAFWTTIQWAKNSCRIGDWVSSEFCQRDSTSLVKKVLPRIFLGLVLYAGCISKGDIMVADIEVETLDASDIHAHRLNAKTL